MSESDLHFKNKALRQMRSAISKHKIPESVKLRFILSYPRSDMGKGTLVAQLLANTSSSNVIKFDGLLNTNKSGRHTTPGHDDFGTYEHFNPGNSYGKDNYILGGELYKDFIDEYGELENLRIKQHLSLYLELTICKMWETLNKPQNLFIEVGGVITDAEVAPVFIPYIQKMQHTRPNTDIILLTESSHNGEYIKTKTIQDGITTLLANGLFPTIILAREPEALKHCTDFKRIENERAIIARIAANLGKFFYKVVSIPFFEGSEMHTYTDFVKQRIIPFLEQGTSQPIVIGTFNTAKYKDFAVYLGGTYQIEHPPYELDIPEGMDSLEENAIAKARTWAILTGKVAIADDTGFFINALPGEPGVAGRRWGGELPDGSTNEDFWKLLQQKTKSLDDLSAYVEQCVAVVAPSGKVEVVYNRTVGYLDKEKLKRPYNNTGYPLAAAFVADNRIKAWDDMSDKEKLAFSKLFIDDLEQAINRVQE